jgi:hypothetical protein
LLALWSALDYRHLLRIAADSDFHELATLGDQKYLRRSVIVEDQVYFDALLQQPRLLLATNSAHFAK